MSRRFNLLAILVLVAVCLFGLTALAEDAATEAATIPAEYKQVAQNSRFELYLREDTMAIIVRSKQNGALLYSTVQDPDAHKDNKAWKGFYQSGVVMEYLEDLKSTSAQADFLNSANTITYDYTENGFTAHITYTDVGIGFDVTLTMDEEGLHMTVPQDSIKETRDVPYMIVEGVEEPILLTRYVKTVKKNEYVFIDREGNEYVLPEANFVALKGKNGVNVLAADGKTQVTLPVTEGTADATALSMTNAEGKAVTVAADTLVSFRTNVYVTGNDLDGKAFRYPEASVKEISETSYTIASIYLYPFLGYSYLGEDDGYMIIPDGQGAIIALENNEGRYKSPFERQVYGTNIGIEDAVNSETNVPAENVIMPVFGMVHEDDQIGFLGVIDEGDMSARILAYPNGVRMNFDWVCAKYTYRLVYNQPMGMNGSAAAGVVPMRTEKARNFDIVQHFLLRDGDQASYAGLAVAYRDHLIRQNTFANAADRAFDVQLDFLGLERENYVFGKQDVVMTSFDQTRQMLSELKAAGVDEMSVVLRGWQDQGLTGGVPTDNFDPAGSLGGKSGLKELRQWAEQEGIDFALEADVLSVNTETHPTLTYSAFKKITSATWSRPTFGKVYATLNYLTPSVSAEMAAKLTADMKNEGLTGVSFTGITQLLADYYYKGAYHDSSEMAAIYTDALKDAGEKLTVTLSSPNAYLWSSANVVSDMPIGGSDYTYTDAEVPFLAIALSGQVPYYAEYVNFQANTRAFFLHLMEQGARPAFLLTWEDPIEMKNTNSSGIYSSRYELYADMIKTWYTDLKGLYDTVGEDGMIVDHVRAGEMVCVTWDNGTKVYLNFGDREAQMDGVTLGKLEWKVVSGNGN